MNNISNGIMLSVAVYLLVVYGFNFYSLVLALFAISFYKVADKEYVKLSFEKIRLEIKVLEKKLKK